MKFPIIKNVYAKLLSDHIIGVRPGETPRQSMHRHLMEQRKKKLNNIKKRMDERMNERIK